MPADLAAVSGLATLHPMLALVALHFAVTIRMYFARLGEMKRERIHPQQLGTRAEVVERLRDSRASDHYANLSELPVLFYPAVMLVWLLGLTDPLYLALAWAFVAARAVHAGIQLTFNRVLWRFFAFISGAALLAALWLRLAADVLT